MVSTDRLLAFAAMSFLLIVIPGPSVLFVVGRALAQGRRAALITVLGNTLGAYALVVAVAFGVGAVVERSAVVFTTLKLVGAAYLVYLGVKAVRQRGVAARRRSRRAVRRAAVCARCGRASRSAWRTPRRSCSSPPCCRSSSTAPRATWPPQMLLLGLVFNLIAVASDSVWGLAAATARSWFARSPRRLALVGGSGGLTMIGLGVTIAITGRKD